MLELIRVFLGYCSNCRLPKMVGEFKIIGWQHVFNLCDSCLKKPYDKLLAEGEKELNRVVREMPVQKEANKMAGEGVY